jgi:hypothetical protein
VRVRRANALTCFAFASQVLEAHDGRCNARNLGRALQTRRFAGSNLLTELKKGSTLLSFLHRFPEKFIVTANDAEGTKDFTVELCRPDTGAADQRASSAAATTEAETKTDAGTDTDSEGGDADDDDRVIQGGAFNYGEPKRAAGCSQTPVNWSGETVVNSADRTLSAPHGERLVPSESRRSDGSESYPPPPICVPSGSPSAGYSSMRVTELRKVLRDLGLSPAGTKKEIVERLEDRQRNELYDWSKKDS